MQKLLSSTRLIGMSAVAGLALASSANAQSVTDPALTIFASNGTGVHNSTVLLGAFTAGSFTINTFSYPSKVYTIPTQNLLDGGGNFIAKINSGSVRFTSGTTNEHAQQILLNLNVTAGTSDTTFTFTTGLMSFTGLASAMTLATTTSATLTDSNGSGFAGYSGLQDGLFRGYRANINGAIPGPTDFAHLNAGYTTGSSKTQSDSIPTKTAIPGVVSSMQTQMSYILSANDSFGMNSNFIVIPAPATLLAFAGGMAGLARRRR